MLKTLIRLPDGREIASGAPGAAVVSARLVRRVNTEKDLAFGAVCPAELTCRLTEAADVDLTPGHRLEVCFGQNKQGVFVVTEAKQQGRHTLRFTARDPLCLLEQDLTQWLEGLTGWPYTLGEFARMVCSRCGLTLRDAAMVNSGYPVQKFTASQVTGKDLLGWVAALCGCFCRADEDGAVVLDWYVPGGSLAPQEQPGSHWYYQDSLTLGAAVEKVDCVHLRPTAGAVGVTYPQNPDDPNPYILAGNFLLASMQPEDMAGIAQNLFARLQGMTYTPCTVTVAASAGILPGQLLQVTDCRGQTHTACVMETVTEKGRTQITGTGAVRRDNSGVQRTLESFRGQLLQLQSGVDWLRAESADGEGRRAFLELELEKLRSRVQQQQTDAAGMKERMSTIQQTASAVDIAVKTLTENGADRVVTKSGYSFTDEGLVISRQGEQMKNLLDHTGMYVRRGEETILQANHKGVEATDVTVRNYLIVGDHARFEDYDNGTACFYI